jgi:hypothetical protein
MNVPFGTQMQRSSGASLNARLLNLDDGVGLRERGGSWYSNILLFKLSLRVHIGPRQFRHCSMLCPSCYSSGTIATLPISTSTPYQTHGRFRCPLSKQGSSIFNPPSSNHLQPAETNGERAPGPGFGRGHKV